MSVATAKLVVGEGNEAGVMVGPIQNSMQYEKVKEFFADIEKEKWTVAAGGNAEVRKPGYFIQPTIIDAPPVESRIVAEEPFGELHYSYAYTPFALFVIIETTKATKLLISLRYYSTVFLSIFSSLAPIFSCFALFC